MIPRPTTLALDAAVRFIRRWPHLYKNWSDEALAAFLTMQGNQDCVRIIPFNGPNGMEIGGLCCCWRLLECNVLDPRFVQGPWRFPLNDPGGDVVYISDLVGFPGTTSKLVADFQWRNPDWRRLKYCALRRGKLKWYDPERLANKLEKL